MENSDLRSIVGGTLKLGLVALAVVYVGMVLTSYSADRSPSRPKVDRQDPVRSAERLAIWLGVRAVGVTKRLLTPLYGMLSEASADVGDWFLLRINRS